MIETTEATEMTEIKKCNRKRVYRYFDSRKPRLRNACPKCTSVSIAMRSKTRDYVCDRCGWIGKGVIKVEY